MKFILPSRRIFRGQKEQPILTLLAVGANAGRFPEGYKAFKSVAMSESFSSQTRTGAGPPASRRGALTTGNTS
jgi:hypothetical protein